MGDKNYIKIETEASVGKKGGLSRWEDLKDQSHEYWSEESMKAHSIEQQYPKSKDKDKPESESAYRERINRIENKIGEYALLDATLEIPPKPGKTYAYGDLDDDGKQQNLAPNDKVYGYRFEPYESSPQTATFYSEVFAEQQMRQGLEDAVADEEKARKKNELIPPKISTPKEYEKQKIIARYYVGSLNFKEKTEEPGVFQGAGSDRYTEEDRKLVERIKESFQNNDPKSDKVEYLVNGKMFEGFFYPLIRQGFFDSPDGTPAAIVLSSDYDDFKESKVDVATVLPLASGEKQLICFDLTTGYGNGKIDRIKRHFEEKRGLADIKYPSTCYKRELAPIKDIPHFVLCLPPDDFGKFRENLAGEKLPSQDIQNLINYQIYAQAAHWAKKWSGEESKQFKKIAIHFCQKLGKNQEEIMKTVQSVRRNHESAIRYLRKMGL